MLKAVLDVNIFVSGIINRRGHGAQIIARSEEFSLWTSEAILQDLARVLHYPHIQKKFNLSENDISDYLARLRANHFLSLDRLEVKVVREDPDDNIIVACALEADADYIITGDPHLLNLKEYRGIQIVTPRAFLEILDRAKQ